MNRREGEERKPKFGEKNRGDDKHPRPTETKRGRIKSKTRTQTQEHKTYIPIEKGEKNSRTKQQKKKASMTKKKKQKSTHSVTRCRPNERKTRKRQVFPQTGSVFTIEGSA